MDAVSDYNDGMKHNKFNVLNGKSGREEFEELLLMEVWRPYGMQIIYLVIQIWKVVKY